jgi:hypothetical protein
LRKNTYGRIGKGGGSIVERRDLLKIGMEGFTFI